MPRADFFPPFTATRRHHAHSGDMDPNTREALLLTVPEAARRLAIGRTLTYELIAANELPAVHIGRAIRVPASALDEFVARRLRPEVTEAGN
jgi:excisionase family DNA binding protein